MGPLLLSIASKHNTTNLTAKTMQFYYVLDSAGQKSSHVLRVSPSRNYRISQGGGLP